METSKKGVSLGVLKRVIEEVTYSPISIQSFSNNKTVNELGCTVTSIKFSWTTNKAPKKILLDSTDIDVTLKSTTISCSLTSNTSFTLKVTDSKNFTVSKSTSVSFSNGIYYGIGTDQENITDSFILGLTKSLQNSISKTFTVTAGDGQYVWFAYPKRYGTPKFNVGGFDGGFSKIADMEFTNASGYTETYTIYRSDNSNLGTQTIKVS
nr:MAG TPA: hypothetical protein [Caudoviricetes sp.]